MCVSVAYMWCICLCVFVHVPAQTKDQKRTWGVSCSITLQLIIPLRQIYWTQIYTGVHWAPKTIFISLPLYSTGVKNRPPHLGFYMGSRNLNSLWLHNKSSYPQNHSLILPKMAVVIIIIPSIEHHSSQLRVRDLAVPPKSLLLFLT